MAGLGYLPDTVFTRSVDREHAGHPCPHCRVRRERQMDGIAKAKDRGAKFGGRYASRETPCRLSSSGQVSVRQASIELWRCDAIGGTQGRSSRSDLLVAGDLGHESSIGNYSWGTADDWGTAFVADAFTTAKVTSETCSKQIVNWNIAKERLHETILN
jgi:hypothetical protein